MKKDQQNSSPAVPRILKPPGLTVSRRINGRLFAYSCFPELRLNGRWLRDSGFESGQQVIVLCEQGQLVIKPIEVPVVEWGEEREYF